MGKLDRKVALVTGAGSGIGRSTAILFAKEGASVVVADIAAESGEDTVKIIKDAGGDAIFVKVDISNAIEVEALMKKTIETYSKIDCAVNNAGYEGIPTLIADCPEEDFDKVVKINLKGTFLCMKYEIQQMLKQGGGAIVNTASVAGMVGAECMPAYVAAKHGVIGLTRTAAIDYGTAGIRVNAVCPGATRTPMINEFITAMPELKSKLNESHPLGRIADPQKIAAAIVWLCSEEASFVTGHPLAVDGGILAK